MNVFLSNFSLRPSCYICPAKIPYVQSDITLADFWGIDKLSPEIDDDKGCGLILVNNLDFNMHRLNCRLYIQNIDEVVKYNRAIINSFGLPIGRETFYVILNLIGFKFAYYFTLCNNALYRWIKIVLKSYEIGILTLPIDVNYGGILQGYALKTILEREGHVVLFLNLRYTPIPLYLRFLVYCKKLIYSYLWGQGRITNKEWKYVSHSVTDFASRYMVFTRSLYNSTDLRNELKKKELDAIIYGSDQIWSRHYSPNLECYFGSFLTESEKIKQLSYAASFGSSCGADYPKEQLDFYRCLLKRFVAVSVREKSGVDICKEYFNVDAEQLLDPTLLLDADDYRKLISAALTRPSKGNLHVYILDETNEK